MTPPETGAIDVPIGLGPAIAALGVWVFGVGMLVRNRRRAKAGKNRHEESMTALSELIRRPSPAPPARAGLTARPRRRQTAPGLIRQGRDGA